VYEPEPGQGRAVLVVLSHADDFALFCGGTLARWADAGWRVVAVRVTDDRWDSVGRTEADTLAANAAEFRAACAVLGVAEVVELGWPTDTLDTADPLVLREQVIRLVRTHRPYALVTFDPFSAPAEDNQDHLVVARAVDEAFWTSQFDLHHPEHLAEGLLPHGCFERWYVGRSVVEVTHVVDITATLDRKVAAALCHDTMLRNQVNQWRLQADTGGWDVPVLDEIAAGGPLAPLWEPLLTASAGRVGDRHGLGAAEEFRMVRFGGLEPLLDRFGRRRV
jgi:LmbE family N-acetylglucosaminyl deacetylase